MGDVIAIDVDLRRIHAWSRDHGPVCYKQPDLGLLLAKIQPTPTTILMEVASATSYQDGDARKLFQKRRWMIYNMAIAGEFSVRVARQHTFLVAPSSAWTKGYPEAVRQKMAKADAKNHDLREVQTMIYFHSIHPTAWVPYAEYLNEKL